MSKVPPQAGRADLRAYTAGDADWVRQVHLDHYARTHHFDISFAEAVDAALSGVAADGYGWIAWHGGTRIGCVFLSDVTSGIARIRLFFVVAEWRSLGLGRRLLAAASGGARAAGAAHLVVATFAEHPAAGRLYAKARFDLMSERKVTAFGQRLHEQHWQKPL